MDIKIRKNTDKYALLFRKKIERWIGFVHSGLGIIHKPRRGVI